MSHYLVIGYPRTGTTSVVDMLLKEHGHYNNFVQDLKYNGVEKWFASDKSVAKMHTHREFKMYGPHLQKIIDRTDKVYYTKLRKDLAEHLISYLCIYLCRLDDQADPVWQLDFKVEFPIMCAPVQSPRIRKIICNPPVHLPHMPLKVNSLPPTPWDHTHDHLGTHVHVQLLTHRTGRRVGGTTPLGLYNITVDGMN